MCCPFGGIFLPGVYPAARGAPHAPHTGAEGSHCSSGNTPPLQLRGRPCTGMCYRATPCTMESPSQSRAGSCTRGTPPSLPSGTDPVSQELQPLSTVSCKHTQPHPISCRKRCCTPGTPHKPPAGWGGCIRGIPPSRTHPPEDGATSRPTDPLLLYPNDTNTTKQGSALPPPVRQQGRR